MTAPIAAAPATAAADVTPVTEVTAIEAATGVLAGFALLALVNAAVIAVVVPLPAAGLGLRVGHLVFDAIETLGVGAVTAAAIGGFVRFARLPGRVRDRGGAGTCP